MSDDNADKKAVQSTERAKALANTVYDLLFGLPGQQGGAQATAVSQKALGEFLTKTGATKDTIDTLMTVAAEVLAAFFAVISAFRHETTHTFDSVSVEIVNEFLGTSLEPSVMSTGKGADETIQKANAIGKAVLARLEQEFSGSPTATQGSGAKAAATFAGYGVNFAIQNAIISLLGACVPETRLEDLRELGVEVAQNLGLGRLMRVALRPLVQTLIAVPYTRELNARYRPNMPPMPELIKAQLASRLTPDQLEPWINEHGFPDIMGKELIEQSKRRLTAQEWNTLTALGKQSDDPAAYDDQANGMDDDWVALRQAFHTWQRLSPLHTRVLSELLNPIRDGFMPLATLDGLLQRLELPADEQALWRTAASAWENVARKRLSLAEMLFLYEAAQLTDDEVQAWAVAEGYSPADQQNLLNYFRLKLIAGAGSKSASRAAALHKEHIAYVTDEITGLWSRPPTPAEMNYWVPLLDSGARTKHDFVTELKGLPTTGPAIPS